MTTFQLRYRLIPDVSPETEWFYLVNETYVGELCIVPLLEELYAFDGAGTAFRRMLARQVDEEREHAARYRELLRDEPLPGSGYDVSFAAYARTLPNVTLKIYALQALLEGVSLGALRYRIAALESNPYHALDGRIMEDELRHTQFGYGFMKYLAAVDGTVPLNRFLAVARDVNHIFAEHFNGLAIARVVRDQMGLPGCSAENIDCSEGMRKFFWKSASSIVDSKSRFLEHYYERATLSAA
jgi:hypothetical protein